MKRLFVFSEMILSYATGLGILIDKSQKLIRISDIVREWFVEKKSTRASQTIKPGALLPAVCVSG